MKNEKNGKGTFFAVNNNRYEGFWLRNNKEGRGKMYYYNGDVYDGMWKTTCAMAKDVIPIKVALIMTANGLTTKRMEKVFSTGMMALNTKALG